MASIKLSEALFPPDHPYHWPVIGSMEDLTAAGYEDVVELLQELLRAAATRASSSRATSIRRRRAGSSRSGSPTSRAAPASAPIAPPPAVLTEEKRVTLEDRVQLPRLYMAWITPPHLHPGDDALDVLSGVLASGKNSRLYKRLVYDLQVAQDVSAVQQSEQLASIFQIAVTARAGPRPRGDREARPGGDRPDQERAAHGPRGRARRQPVRGVLLPRDGAGRRIRRSGRPV